MNQCNHPNPIPGLDAHFCRACRFWFQEAWQLEAEVKQQEKKPRRGRKKKDEPTEF